MEMPVPVTSSPLRSHLWSHRSDRTAPLEKRRLFFKLHPLLYNLLSISMELYYPSSK